MIARSVGVASVTCGEPPRLYVHRPQPFVESVLRRTLDEPPSSAPRGRRPARTRASDPVSLPRSGRSVSGPMESHNVDEPVATILGNPARS